MGKKHKSKYEAKYEEFIHALKEALEHATEVEKNRVYVKRQLTSAQVAQYYKHQGVSIYKGRRYKVIWERIKAEPGKILELAWEDTLEVFLTIKGKALQARGVETYSIRRAIQSLEHVLVTDFNCTGQRSFAEGLVEGESVTHLGMRHRFAYPGAPYRVYEGAKFKEGFEEQYKTLLGFVQKISNTAILEAAQWGVNEMLTLAMELHELHGEAGTASFAHQMVSLGCNNETPIHLDDKDIATALWAALGRYHMAIPEAELILDIEDGDVLTFSANKLWHNLISPRPAPDHVCISLYVNGGQLQELRRAKSAKQAKVDVEAEGADLSEFERGRLRNIARNREKLAELGLA